MKNKFTHNYYGVKDQEDITPWYPCNMTKIIILLAALFSLCCNGFLHQGKLNRLCAGKITINKHIENSSKPPVVAYGQSLVNSRNVELRDILGLGPAEIAISLVVALVLFGPETLKSLTKDVGKAAAELKELPKTFKEGMEEGSESSQVSKMKAIAAEKRAKRDAVLAGKGVDDEEEESASA